MHLPEFVCGPSVQRHGVLDLQAARPRTRGDGETRGTTRGFCFLLLFILTVSRPQVFYYHEKPFPPVEGRFRKKVEWAGDVSGRDGSVVLRKVPFSFNGTFSCQVKNPPDVHGNVGEVRLRVVTTGERRSRSVRGFICSHVLLTAQLHLSGRHGWSAI